MDSRLVDGDEDEVLLEQVHVSRPGLHPVVLPSVDSGNSGAKTEAFPPGWGPEGDGDGDGGGLWDLRQVGCIWNVPPLPLVQPLVEEGAEDVDSLRLLFF